MAPPPTAAPAIHPVVREVTEDTPPDLLEGTMDLLVILPSGKTVQTTVDRKTPMMDLLIHIATANKINPAGHIVQVRNERGIEMPYKPSTPIGALDTTSIEIVPKNRVNEYIIVKKPAKVANQPFETTFRLQVHLPRNQLYVMRISPKTLLNEILREVCQEKNLDIAKYEIRHPVNLDQKLLPSMSVGETGLHELTVVSKNSKINSSVSTADIIALQQSDEKQSFKHSRSSVGDSSVSSESTGSGRGTSPCRSEDSRSISPLPLIRPKTLIQRPSNVSTCSSSGNSSGLHRSNTLEDSMSNQVSHQQVVMQAPPRTKKRAAPQPPSTPGAKVNSLNCSTTSSIVSPISEKNVLCSTPIAATSVTNSSKMSGVGSAERPTPRKKEAPREPPKQHAPLSHHQSLPINHSRHNSGNTSADFQQGVCPIQQDRTDSRSLERSTSAHPAIAKMSSRHSISSSMTNLTSVSSTSSTSLASSTGGSSKKRRAPKPPVLSAVNPPSQIEEETSTTDGEVSSLRGDTTNSSPQKQLDQVQVDVHQHHHPHSNAESLTVEAEEGTEVDVAKEIEVLSASPVSAVSSLSSPSNSASESASSSPIPPTNSKELPSSVMSERSLNTNEGNGRPSPSSVQKYDEMGRSSATYSRSSSSPSSSNNNVVAAARPPSPDSVCSRNRIPSSIAVDDAQSVVEETPSCRPPSSNTQVSSSTSAKSMPMPLPRRRAPAAPDIASKVVSGQTGNREKAPLQQPQLVSPATSAQPDPKPKPRPRPDRISVESMISKTSMIIKPKPHSQLKPSLSSESTPEEGSFENETPSPPPPVLSGQLRNPLAKYGIKVLPDNVLKERAERLKRENSTDLAQASAYEDAPSQSISSKVPIRASKSSTSDSPNTEEFSDSGSVTSFSKSHVTKKPSSEKPLPTLSKSDYTSQGSVRSITQLSKSSPSSSVNDDDSDSDNLEENLDFFEPVPNSGGGKTRSLRNPILSQSSVPSRKEKAPPPPVTARSGSINKTTKSRVSSSVSTYEDIEKEGTSVSPGAVSESGFTRTASSREYTAMKAKNAEDTAKLNRWQNMVSLNEIENLNKAKGVTTPGSGSIGVSSRPHRGDYPHSKSHRAVEESQNDATCHSSESEASYTDSGVPATETVTPSPVNLDDVILDHEYHTGSHPEKDGDDELKNSSRRSSVHSDHSEEWMNILEAKMNKDEEAIEKMFEAALPGDENGCDSPIMMANGGDRTSRQSSPEVREESEKLVESVHKEQESQISMARGMIETTVELHHTPDPSETESGQSSLEKSDVPVRKLSKSESFSHNSEFDEAKKRRKNFSSRSNALHRSSQSSGSATDLRHTSSSSEEDDGMTSLELNKNPLARGKYNQNLTQKANHMRDDRTVSMSNLSAANEGNPKTQSFDEQSAAVHKAASLQKLSVDSSEEPVAVEVYRKQLEMQFEQWKEEFMKKHTGPPGSEPSISAISQDADAPVEEIEQTVTHKVQKSEVDEVNDKGLDPEEPHIIHAVGTAIAVTAEVEATVILETSSQTESRKENDISKAEQVSVTDSFDTKTQSEHSEMKDVVVEDFTKVELRKKKVESQESSSVIYKYSGPPTIKMASWNERPRRAVSVKNDEDYIMGMGQQDPNAKTANQVRTHSFHGAPVIPLIQTQTSSEKSNGITLKNKPESSPTPAPSVVKGWSAALNAANLLPNSTGSVRNVVSAWKQKMEETEKDKTKPKDGPPAEIDIYAGTENAIDSVPSKPVPPPIRIQSQDLSTKSNASEKTALTKTPSVTVSVTEYQAKPVVVNVKPATVVKSVSKPPEKTSTLGSSFRTEKPVIVTTSDSNTLPKTKPVVVAANNATNDAVDSKPIPATSTVEITSSASLQERKKFFQGIKPVENGKEAPIPAANLKNNIATIQKVFEKQRMSKMHQMGSQQSLFSDGTISPVPSLQRNDSLESGRSNNSTLQRHNSIESHSSDASSVVLRVSHNSSGKASPQISSTEMVQKLFGRPNSFNVDAHRRTPSPISSTTSTLSSSTSYERFTPSPTVVDGPNNSVRITTGGYKPPTNQSTTIRSVGNKAIIIVNGDDGTKAKDSKGPIRNEVSSVNQIILDEGKNSSKKSPVTSTYISAIGLQQQTNKRDSAPPPATKQMIISGSTVNSRKISIETTPAISQNNVKNVQSNGAPPPPPPPPVDGVVKPQLNLNGVKSLTSTSNGNVRNSKPSTPTSPTSPDPRSEIFNVIKNSNGNFGLKKTGSTILLK